jgi:hypothetical protein
MSEKNDLINQFSFDNIRNIYESKVINQMNIAINDFDQFDGCENCLRDVYALALSRIPSTYAISKTRSNIECLPEAEILEIVRYAIYQVMKKPNHEA